MKKFNSLEEIRKEIDEIDIKVFDFICKRKDLVSQVIKFKKKHQIIDEIRIKKILLRLEKEAKKKRYTLWYYWKYMDGNDKKFYKIWGKNFWKI